MKFQLKAWWVNALFIIPAWSFVCERLLWNYSPALLNWLNFGFEVIWKFALMQIQFKYLVISIHSWSHFALFFVISFFLTDVDNVICAVSRGHKSVSMLPSSLVSFLLIKSSHHKSILTIHSLSFSSFPFSLDSFTSLSLPIPKQTLDVSLWFKQIVLLD